MKKIFLMFGLLVFSIFAQAQDDVCAEWIEFAELTMTSKQAGVTAEESVRIVERVFEDEDSSLPLHIVELANEMPVFDNESDKQEAIETFTSLFSESCYAGEFGKIQ